MCLIAAPDYRDKPEHFSAAYPKASMALAYNNALYGSSVNTPLQGYNVAYGARSNAAFSPATSPTENTLAVAQSPGVGDTMGGTTTRFDVEVEIA